MRKLLRDFGNHSHNDAWYDLKEDWPLIEASLAKQYGIRIRQHRDMPWDEFCTLVAGLMPDTPLGSIVTIRAEKDQKVIKSFTPDQRKIHRDWQKRQAAQKLANPDQLKQDVAQLSKMFASMFGGGHG